MNLPTKLSIILNALLLLFLAWASCDPPRPEARACVSHRLTKWVMRAPSPPEPAPSRTPVPQTVEIREPFHWAQLESTDYRAYLANLRSVGCPEPTVRDIVKCDVNDLFTGRVKALVDEVTGGFWELIIRKEDFEKMVNEKHSQLQDLKQEREEMMHSLFGSQDPSATADEARDPGDQPE
jgi:hypothetical protein